MRNRAEPAANVDVASLLALVQHVVIRVPWSNDPDGDHTNAAFVNAVPDPIPWANWLTPINAVNPVDQAAVA